MHTRLRWNGLSFYRKWKTLARYRGQAHHRRRFLCSRTNLRSRKKVPKM
ncbi:unnamed protein product [Strongylus vulgaris]|uniref:Uncharacterized protein n=1 Tax=Strongylus vulgaris TaxID=40348 RepID=A0A3P7KDD2_STRVU|nr:unnamed protein product [Strongylus vulgaris]